MFAAVFVGCFVCLFFVFFLLELPIQINATEWSCTEFGERMGYGPRKNPLKVGIGPYKVFSLGIFT